MERNGNATMMQLSVEFCIGNCEMHFMVDFNEKSGRNMHGRRHCDWINLTFGSCRCKTMGSCVYNEYAEKKGSFCSFIACDVTCKLM